MKIAFFLPLLFLLCISAAFAQTNQYILSGSIVTKDGKTYPYKLVFSDSLGIVKGYSLTYSEPDQAKTAIRGKLDRSKRTLSFRETEILYSHGYHINTYMCLVKAALEYTRSMNSNVLSGFLSNKEADNISCAGGNVIFSDESEIKKLFATHEQFDTVITMKRKAKDTTHLSRIDAAVIEEPAVTEKVTAGIEKAYEWHSDTVIIDIWDGGNIDGDRVSLQFNGKPYLTQYYLVKEKKQLRIPLEGNGINTLSILADNEGSDPPNTATLRLTDGSTQYNILAYNAKGDKAIIRIKRVK